MKWLIIAVLLLLSACGYNGPNYHTVEAQCAANTRPFVETWPCMRMGLAGTPGPFDLKQYYFSTGDLVAERIKEGTLTEAEGRMVMADALAKVVTQEAQRSPGTSAPYYRPIVYQQMGPQTVIGY